MKQVAILIIALFAFVGVQAQKSAQAATAEMTKIYQLDEAQQAEVLKIQERKVRNLSEIQALKTTDRATYIKKLKSIQYGTDVSLKRLLNKSQMETYYKVSTERRKKQAVLSKEMKARGASSEEIEEAMAEME